MRLFKRGSKATQPVEPDLADWPDAVSPEGLERVQSLLEQGDFAAVERLYRKSIALWRTDWQRGLCEVMCKLDPGNNTLLILWLSACISDDKPENATPLHGFIEKLPLSDEEMSLWQDANVHYALMLGEIGRAEKILRTLSVRDPDYDVIWPKIALIRKYAAVGRTNDVIKHARAAIDAGRVPPEAMATLMECLFQCGDFDYLVAKTLGASDETLETAPAPIGFGAAAMMEQGRADLALVFLMAHAKRLHLVPQAWFTLREAALRLDQYSECRELLQNALGETHDDGYRFRRGLMQVDESDLQGAEATLSTFDKPNSELALQLRLITATQQPGIAGAFEAYGAYIEEGHPRAPAAQIYAGNLYGQARSQSDLERANLVLETAQETGATGADFLDLRLKSLIALSRTTEAETLFTAQKKTLRRESLNRYAQYFAAAKGAEQQARSYSFKAVSAGRNRAVHNASDLPDPVTFNHDPDRDQVLCFSCVFNGMEFVEWFLDYYRALGVDHFFLVDNTSTDGTAAFLEQQTDVSLFSAKGSFKDAAHGVFWVNDLMTTFAHDKWSFFVDMDEAFVFPMMDQGRSLQDLLGYFDENAYRCTPSLMIDMFSTSGEGGSFADNCYFDNDYLSFPVERAPYRAMQGGFRTRMTGRNMLITKSPLVKGANGFSYIENNHFHTHLRPSDITTGLLHYKFVGRVSARVEEAIERKEHFLGATFYKDLKRSLAGQEVQNGSPFDAGPRTMKYQNAQTLVDAGVMHTTDTWATFTARNPKK